MICSRLRQAHWAARRMCPHDGHSLSHRDSRARVILGVITPNAFWRVRGRPRSVVHLSSRYDRLVRVPVQSELARRLTDAPTKQAPRTGRYISTLYIKSPVESPMASERVQRQISRILREAEDASAKRDWKTVRDRAQHVLTFDPQSPDGLPFESPFGCHIVRPKPRWASS